MLKTNIDRRSFLKTIGLTTVALTMAATSARPNIILIMSDDMGYSDIGCYGSEINTPNLDGLAASGLRFTHFYNTARCCPTRASLITGLYPHQAGIGHMTSDRGQDGYRGELNRQCVTIAEALKPAGYSTYAVGKWHVTKSTHINGPMHNWPIQRGFDKFYGTIQGAGSFFDPSTLTRDNKYITPYNDPEYKPEQFYYTDAISDNTVMYINDHCKTKSDKPFFMYVMYTTAHWPMHALEKDIAKYKGKYDAGYGAIRNARYKRMKKLGVIEDHWKISPIAGNWKSMQNKKWEACCMEVYAAMVDNMDQGIGRIVDSLEKNGKLDNTLIMFIQDNGGCAENMGRKGVGKKRNKKPTLPPMDPNKLQVDVIPKQTRDGYPMRQGSAVMPGPADTYIGYGKAWANVSNVPFREYKHWVHEGGISTPLIVHWPASIKTKNELRHQPSHLIDIMATCVDVSNAKYPKEYKGKKITPMEGKSLLPVFTNDKLDRETIYWEHEGNRAVRKGKWKLVAKEKDGKWELYDMQADRSELNNLANQHPEKVKELSRMWQEYAERANVIPWPDSKGGKKKKTSR